ncbi:MAG TPA: hypothetical protein VLF59_00390 [Candidatus Saccharimonadales bacterium]|nr:hypothetical protein [Candidatus Saccharimonadales bacterium]
MTREPLPFGYTIGVQPAEVKPAPGEKATRERRLAALGLSGVIKNPEMPDRQQQAPKEATPYGGAPRIVDGVLQQNGSAQVQVPGQRQSEQPERRPITTDQNGIPAELGLYGVQREQQPAETQQDPTPKVPGQIY